MPKVNTPNKRNCFKQNKIFNEIQNYALEYGISLEKAFEHYQDRLTNCVKCKCYEFVEDGYYFYFETVNYDSDHFMCGVCTPHWINYYMLSGKYSVVTRVHDKERNKFLGYLFLKNIASYFIQVGNYESRPRLASRDDIENYLKDKEQEMQSNDSFNGLQQEQEKQMPEEEAEEASLDLESLLNFNMQTTFFDDMETDDISI